MKNIIVVTGASNGMGKEFLKQILEREPKIDNIWAIDRDQAGLDQLAKEFDKIIKIQADLTDSADLLKIKHKLEKEQPNIKILANCAGFGIFDHSENIATETKLNMIDLNIKAYVAMIDFCLPHTKRNAKIMNIASCAGFQPVPYINNYAATKAFIVSYSRALNQELKYKNIHVLTVTPFWTKTKFFDRAVIKDKKTVVIKYTAMYDPVKVMALAIRDLYTNKEVSVYGFTNKVQRLLAKLMPHSLIMKIWMNQQKYDGTPKIRK